MRMKMFNFYHNKILLNLYIVMDCFKSFTYFQSE